MLAVFKREFKSYFISMTGFLICAALLLFAGVFFTQFHLRGQYADFEYSLQSLCTVLLLLVPILTMRSLAEDKRAKTDRLLYSLPLKLSHIILGKYFAMLAVLAVPTLVISIYPLILCAFGTVNLAAAYSCLLAFFLLGAALIALCMFLSGLAESPVIAAVLGFGAVFMIYILRSVCSMIPTTAAISFGCFVALGLALAPIVHYLTKNPAASCVIGAVCVLLALIVFLVDRSAFEGLFPAILGKLALFNRFESFVYGIFDISAIVLYLSFSGFFVTLTVLTAEKKRWN